MPGLTGSSLEKFISSLMLYAGIVDTLSYHDLCLCVRGRWSLIAVCIAASHRELHARCPEQAWLGFTAPETTLQQFAGLRGLLLCAALH